MNINTIKSLAAGVVLGVAAVLGIAAVSETHNETKWEYKQSPTKVGDDTLNKWADEGWSVVCVGTDANNGHFYVLKRPKK